MNAKYWIGALLMFAVQTAFSQQKLPIIRASSDMVDIRNGDEFRKNAWTIAPEYKPDIYITNKKRARVTFITDLDSISFVAKPGKTYDFIILLNNKDTAYTQIKYEEGSNFLETLKAADKFNVKDSRKLPAFTYQPSDDPHLVALRKGFNLDSIAGTGNEVSKIISLLHWIHDLIPHDGQNGNPEVKNAMSMIAECKRDHRGLNCRGLATVLNECYLSLGIPSRFITCLPKDSNDTECHVINMVYASELKKWIWIDPTHDAYIMDEAGMLLGIEEVRERLINGKTLIVNPDANWNNRNSTIKEEYLYNYMAKNLYRFSCPASSEYDTETAGKGKVVQYIDLVPLDYYDQKPDMAERVSDVSGNVLKTYKTNNPLVFWATPK